MKLAELYLQHFRNYPKRTFSFSQNTTIFVGPNAIGKTNILEAIFLLAIGKSFRAERESEAIEYSQEVGRIKAVVASHPERAQRVEGSSKLQMQEDSSTQFIPMKIGTRNDNNIDEILNLELVITKGIYQGEKIPVKKYLVNGVSRRAVDFVGNFKVVLFEPEDVELIRGSPGKKRRYLDFILVQIDREYRRSLTSYEKGLRQRNRLLEQIRDFGKDERQLYFWDQLLIKNGEYLSRVREEFLNFLNTSAKPFGNFRVLYDHSHISESRFAQYHEAEIASAQTLVGPHRDNFEVFERERNLSQFGSRGEQRLAVLWLKISELTFIEQKSGSRPLLLLDDIFSELDHGHRDEVMALVGKQQTVITTTDVHFIPENIKNEVEMVELRR